MYMPILLVEAVFRKGRQQRRSLYFGSLAVLVIAFALPLGLWTWRNFKELGVPIYTTTQGGVMFYVGNSKTLLEDPREAPTAYYGDKELVEKIQRLGEITGDRYLFNQGKMFLLALPSRTLRLLWIKLKFFLRPFPEAGRIVQWISFLSFALAIAFSISVFFGVRRRPHFTWFTCLAVILVTIIIHVILLPAGRYRLPIECLMLLMAALPDSGREEVADQA
jgi:hypothetical protein